MKSMSLSQKIWCIVGLLSFAFVGSTAFSLTSLTSLRNSMNELTGKVVKRDQITSQLLDNQRRLAIMTAEAIIFTAPERLARNEKTFVELLEKQSKDLADYKNIASVKGQEKLNEYLVVYEKYLAELKETRAFAAQNKNQEASAMYEHARDEFIEDLRKHMGELNDMTATQLAESSSQANSDASNAIWMGFLISTISIFFSVLIAFFVLRTMTRAISEVVKNLSDSSMQVSGAATQIASSSEELSQSATEQAASLEETAASVEEMNSMVAKNSENAKSAEQTSGKSQESVRQGKEVIQKMTNSMEAINRSSEGMADTVKVIEQIDKKTKVINEIVNKTELLSFNASVEAARAGEHGKGFAVVAEEVGNLARMSGAAAEEIAALLEESISKVNQMVQDTKKNVDMGAQITRECGEVFEQIVLNVSSVSGMATEISAASQEQSRGCQEITKAMTQLDQMTQQNAATSEECASAAEELSAQAEALTSAVAHLVVTVSGKTSEAHTASNQPKAAKKFQHKPQGKHTSNIVQLKTPRSGSIPPVEVLKKASGMTPEYDSDGFTEV